MKSLFFIVIILFSSQIHAQPSIGTTYGGVIPYEYFYTGINTSDGGFIMAGGQSLDASFSTVAPWLVKTNAIGDTLWSRRYPNIDADIDAVEEIGTGGYFVAGGNYCAVVDASGDLVWEKNYTDRSFFDVTITSDGHYLAAGYLDTLPVHQAYLVKFDANGDTIWTRTLTPTLALTNYRFSTIEELPNGNYIAMGTKANGLDRRGFIEELTPQGGLENYREVGEFIIRGMRTLDNGYFLFSTEEIIKIDQNFDTVWVKDYIVEGYIIREAIELSTGGYALAGWGSNQGLLLELDALGNTVSTEYFADSTGTIYLYGVMEESNGNIVGVGYATSNNTDGYLTKDSTSLVSTSVVEIELMPTFKLYPNPSQDVIYIQTELDLKNSFSYALMNNLGQVVEHGVLNNNLNVIDLKELSLGIYWMLIYDDTMKKQEAFQLQKN
ncbi:MAG: T9SS type A sorting domain-containing protein [Saprospiraceae bacterium]|nr:T9SS type A sorting domain-containing protein [Saprospiraceae bacterium]